MSTRISIRVSGPGTTQPAPGFAGAMGMEKTIPGDEVAFEAEVDELTSAAESGLWIKDVSDTAAAALDRLAFGVEILEGDLPAADVAASDDKPRVGDAVRIEFITGEVVLGIVTRGDAVGPLSYAVPRLGITGGMTHYSSVDAGIRAATLAARRYLNQQEG